MDNNIIDKRTPGIWVENKYNSGLIESDNGEDLAWKRNGICKVYGDTRKGEAKANTAFIIKACNEWEGLNSEIKTLENVRDEINKSLLIEIGNHSKLAFEYDKLKEQNKILLDALKEAQPIVEYAINITPTSENRNGLTHVNIKLLEAINKCNPLT